MRYGLSTLLLVVFIAAIVCGIALEGSFIAFGVGFVAFAMLLLQLMARPGARPLVVRDFASDLDAHLLCNYLVDRGVSARVEGSQGWQYPGTARTRVVVPPDQAERAESLLQEFDTTSSLGQVVDDAHDRA